MSHRHTLRIGYCGLLLACLMVYGCGKPPSASSDQRVSYHPDNDPLVNPPEMFQAPPEDRSQIATDETLYLQLDGNPNTLNPIFGSSMYDINAQSPLFDSMFTFDANLVWGINEAMVESLEESEDHRVITVRIKPGLKWQDGQPFTAHDVVFSWQAILDDAVPALTHKSSIEPVTNCVALDDLTIQYTQDEPNATRFWNLLFPVVPKHLFEKDRAAHPDLKTGEYYNRLARDGVVGNGPYMLVEFVENERVVYERWEGYHGAQPHYKRIVMRIIPDNSIALLSFEKGDIDLFERLSAQQFADDTVNNPTFAKVGNKALGTEWSYGYIGWNMDGSNPFFNDVKVRRAMAHAMNIPLFLEKVYYNLAEPCLGVYHPTAPMYNPEIEPITYDLVKAGTLLDEAGWTVDPADGWRYKTINGRKVAFAFTLTIPQGSPTGPKIAAIFQEDLKKIGVRMDTTVMEWAAFLVSIREHKFQAQTSAWGTGADPDTGWNLWRTEQYTEGRNYGGYSNPQVDELFKLARHEFDPVKRNEYYQRLSKIIYDDQPYLFLYNRPTLSAVNKRIRGIQFSPRGLTGFTPGELAWWTPAGGAAVSMSD